MTLSKKRNKERMRESRATCVQPKEPWQVTDWANYKGDKLPLPNCPDGRHRDATD